MCIASSPTLDTFLFRHKEWKLWHKLLSLPDSEYELTLVINGHHEFDIRSYPDWAVLCTPKDKEAFIFNKRTQECVLCSYYKSASKKLYKKLMKLK